MNYQIDMDSIAAIYGTAISFYLDQRIEAAAAADVGGTFAAYSCCFDHKSL